MSEEDREKEQDKEQEPEGANTEKKSGLWDHLVAGLSKTRDFILEGMDNAFYVTNEIGESFYDDL